MTKLLFIYEISVKLIDFLVHIAKKACYFQPIINTNAHVQHFNL